MKLASLTTSLTRPETIWQWLCLLTLVCLGWISREQLGVMFAEIDGETENGALLVLTMTAMAMSSCRMVWRGGHILV